MIHNAKKLLQRLNEIPEGLSTKFSTSEFYRSYVWLTYVYLLSGLIHLFFIPLFVIIGVIALALFNILSVVTWVSALVLHRRGNFIAAYLLINLEIIAHAVLCVILIGWDSGFQYYLLIMAMAAFLANFYTLSKGIQTAIQVLGVVSNCVCFIILNHYSHIMTPIHTLNPSILNALNWVNIISICAIMSIFSYSYTRETRKAEEKLELEHQRTTRALEERNKALIHLNEELAEAAEYVRMMFPKPITEGDIHTNWRFIPSTSLGGDAFGYHWLDNDDFAIYLIDVSGHGVGAALLSASVINVLRSQSLPSTDFSDPEQVLESLNLAFPSEENNDMFFTIWYGVYNIKSRDLTYASGGHPPALILSVSDTNGSLISELKTPNFVIGGMPNSKYMKLRYNVAKNSTLYIFSDGCYEVEKADGSMWRFDEFSTFMEKLRIETLSNLDSLYYYAKGLGNKEHLMDDFTIVEVAFG